MATSSERLRKTVGGAELFAKAAQFDPYGNDIAATYATKAEIADKVDAVQGKGLSTNDYTASDKEKLGAIESGAEVNVIETVKVDGTALTVTDKAVDITLSGKADKADLTVTPGTGLNADKTTIQLKSGVTATVLTAHQDLSEKQDVIADIETIRSGAALGSTAVQPSSLKTVATTGSYDDLTNKPSIPSFDSTQMASINSGVNSTKVGNYDSHIADTTNHVTSTDKTNWNAKEDASNKSQTLDPTSTTEFPSSAAAANFVNSSVATATANFLGNYDLTDLDLTYPATTSQIETALDGYSFIPAPTNNDYVYVEVKNPQTTGIDDEVQRYKFNGTSWRYEYTLNNSSFTAAEKAAIDSGIDSTKVGNYNAHIANTDIHVTTSDKSTWNGKQDAISDLQTIRLGASAGSTAVQPRDLATVSTTGDYDDLLNKPTIPNVDQVYDGTSTNAQSGTAVAGAISTKQDTISDLQTIRSGASLGATAVQPRDLATVASTGSYNDLVDKPDIPSGVIVDQQFDAASTNAQSGTAVAGAVGDKADKANITGATKCKITYNGQGIVTDGSDLSDSDIPNLPASKITSGTFDTDRIADDAITAAKVKDNETLPVNVTGTATHLSAYGTCDSWDFSNKEPYEIIAETTFDIGSENNGDGSLIQMECGNSDLVKLKMNFVTRTDTTPAVFIAQVFVLESTQSLSWIKENIIIAYNTPTTYTVNIRIYVHFDRPYQVWRARQLDCQTGDVGYTNWRPWTFYQTHGSTQSSIYGTRATYILTSPIIATALTYFNGQTGYKRLVKIIPSLTSAGERIIKFSAIQTWTGSIAKAYEGMIEIRYDGSTWAWGYARETKFSSNAGNIVLWYDNTKHETYLVARCEGSYSSFILRIDECLDLNGVDKSEDITVCDTAFAQETSIPTGFSELTGTT